MILSRFCPFLHFVRESLIHKLIAVWLPVAIALLFGIALASKPVAWASLVSVTPNQSVPDFNFRARLPQIELAPIIVPPPLFPPACYPTACQLTNTSGDNVIGDEAPAWSPNGLKIDFFRGFDCVGGGLYQMNVDGSHLTILSSICTHVPVQWSPDSAMIATISGGPTLYIMNADGSNAIPVNTDRAYIFFPSWSPEGNKILFGAKECCVDIYDLYTVDSDGSHSTMLFSGANYSFTPSWSPDGSRILFGVPNNGTYDIYTIDANGGAAIKLMSNARFDATARWSPDGSKILYVSVQDSNSEIYVMRADGSNPVNLSNDPEVDETPLWSPDGNKIAFVSSRDGVSLALYSMNADGTNITTLHGGAYEFQWSPDSSKLVFASYSSNVAQVAAEPGPPYHLFVAKADGAQTSEIFSTEVNGFIHNASWSPSGKHIVFDSNQSIYVIGVPQ